LGWKPKIEKVNTSIPNGLGLNQQGRLMKRVKHIIFWIAVIGIILLLFSSHVIA
jgi:hypothetical protein